MNDCPDLGSIMRKERRLIKIRRLLKEEKRKTIKTQQGISLIPSLPSKPFEVGVSRKNGIPVRPILDTRLRKRGSRTKKKI